jgi:hypothetical protein
MKTQTLILIGIAAVAATLVWCAPKAAPSGTYCADVGADAARVEEAYGSILNLGRPATTAEIETAMKPVWLSTTTLPLTLAAWYGTLATPVTRR